MKRLRQVVVVFFLGFFGLLSGLLMSEVVLRVFFKEKLQTEEPFTAVDPYLGWRHRRDWKGVWLVEGHSVPIALNNRGLRSSHPVSEKKPADTKRILFLGDSSTAGFEVPEEKTFVSLLEARLRQRNHAKYEFLNAGVRGWGTDQCELWLRNEGIKFHPEVVVYTFCHNDLFDNLKEKIKANYTIENGKLRLHMPDVSKLRRKHFLKYLYVRRLFRMLTRKENVGTRLATNSERKRRNEWFEMVRSLDLNSKEWQLMSLLIKRMDDLCHQIGARFYVTSIVMPMEYDDHLLELVGGDRRRDGEDPYHVHTRLATVCKRLGVPFIQTLPAFRRHYHSDRATFWWKADNHYNEKGHELTADLLYAALAGDPLLASHQ